MYGGRDEMHIFSDIYQYSICKIDPLDSLTLLFTEENKWRYVKCQLGMEGLEGELLENRLVQLSEPKLRFGHTSVTF